MSKTVEIPPKCSNKEMPDLSPPEHDWHYCFDADGAYERFCLDNNCEAEQVNTNYPNYNEENWVDKEEI